MAAKKASGWRRRRVDKQIAYHRRQLSVFTKEYEADQGDKWLNAMIEFHQRELDHLLARNPDEK